MMNRYQLLHIRPARPTSWREALAIAWGLDIFVGRWPLLKVFLVGDILCHVLF